MAWTRFGSSLCVDRVSVSGTPFFINLPPAPRFHSERCQFAPGCRNIERWLLQGLIVSKRRRQQHFIRRLVDAAVDLREDCFLIDQMGNGPTRRGSDSTGSRVLNRKKVSAWPLIFT